MKSGNFSACSLSFRRILRRSGIIVPHFSPLFLFFFVMHTLSYFLHPIDSYHSWMCRLVFEYSCFAKRGMWDVENLENFSIHIPILSIMCFVVVAFICENRTCLFKQEKFSLFVCSKLLNYLKLIRITLHMNEATNEWGRENKKKTINKT